MNKFSKFALSFYIISIVLTFILIFTNGFSIALEIPENQDYMSIYQTPGPVGIYSITKTLIGNIILFVISFILIGGDFGLKTIYASFMLSFVMDFMEKVLHSYALTTNMLLAIISGTIIIATGLGIAFAINASTGGTDILSLALSIKKGVSFGKYQMIFNGVIMVLGGFLSKEWNAILYTFVYIGTSSYVIDLIHTKNRKVMLEVISKKGQEISEVLLKEAHHGVTIIEGVGAYTKEKKDLLHIVVSTYQLTEIVTIIKNIDDASFVLQVPVNNIYGRFYMPPFK